MNGIKIVDHDCGYIKGAINCLKCDSKIYDDYLNHGIECAERNMETLNEAMKPKEMVNSPDHYKGNKFEVIDIIEDYELGFNLGNAVKYLLRAGKKDNIKQDLEKAIWYIKRENSRLERWKKDV